MNIFTKKSIIQKIAIVCIFLTLFNFVTGMPVYADNSAGFGGKLLEPIITVVVRIGDGVMDVIHSALVDQDQSRIEVSTSSNFWEILVVIVIAIVAIAVAVGLTLLCAWGVAALGSVLMGAGGVGFGAALATMSAVQLGSACFVAGLGGGAVAVAYVTSWDCWKESVVLPFYQITPEEIFSNKLPIFDVNFFKPNTYYNLDGNEVESIAYQLQSTIASWYYTLRNIAIIVLLSILVYIGIRMLLSSIASEKAKYKNMIMDWLVAMVLIFIMHYIMYFAVYITEKFNDLIERTADQTKCIDFIADKNDKIKNALEKSGFTLVEAGDILNGADDSAYEAKLNEAKSELQREMIVQTGDLNGEKTIIWKTDLIGISRILAWKNRDQTAMYIGYSLIFCVLVVFTVIFVFTYFKRVLYLAFLTMIAPLVAMTYPIDKVNDGSAQAFNAWLKEYIFNLLIQPVHLLLYTILITSSFNLAGTNLIYSLVAIGFMVPAEKLLRKFFGFEKAQTPGVFAGAAGAGMMMAGLQKMSSISRSENDKTENVSNSPKMKQINDNGEFSSWEIAQNQAGAFPSSPESNTGSQENSPSLPRSDASLLNTGLPRSDASLPKTQGDQTRKIVRPKKLKLKKGPRQKKTDKRNVKTKEPKRIRFSRNTPITNTPATNTPATNTPVTNTPATNTPVTNTPVTNKKRYKGNILRAIGKAAGVKLERNFGGGKPVKGLAKISQRAASGALTATLGFIASIPEGNLSNIGRNVVAGYAIGDTLGKTGMNKLSNIADEETTEEFKKGYYGENYNEHEREKAIQKYINDSDNIEYLRQHLRNSNNETLTLKEVKELLGGKETRECLNAGITDVSDLATIHQMRIDKPDTDIETAIMGAKFSKKLGAKSKSLTSSAQKDIDNQIHSRYGVTDDGKDTEEGRRVRQAIYSASDKFIDTKSMITKNDMGEKSE